MGWARSRLGGTVTPPFLVGAGLVAGATYLFAVLTGTRLVDDAFAGRYVELLMLGVPAVGLGYAGAWLHVAEFDPDRIRHIGTYAVAGAVVGSSTTALVLLLGALPVLGERATFVLFVATGTEGGLLGVLVGTFAATDGLFRRERAAVDEFEMLHGLLRHNVRNRLTLIDGYLTLLTEELAMADRKSVAIIEAQLEAIESLLEHTRLATEAVGGSGTLESVDMVAVVRDQLGLLEASHDGLAVEADLPERAPVLAGDLLAPVVENVLSNAVVHHDRPTATITVCVTRSNGEVRLRVADDGPGIPSSRRESVFEAGAGAGTGMGLYLARRIVERYGGTIELGDNEPRGTVVAISLARADDGRSDPGRRNRPRGLTRRRRTGARSSGPSR